MAPIPVYVPLIHMLSDSTLVRLVEVALAEPDIVPPETADGVLEELEIRYYRALLKAKMSLKTKNNLLYSHLLWCFKSNRIRYYPESVYIFAD